MCVCVCKMYIGMCVYMYVCQFIKNKLTCFRALQLAAPSVLVICEMMKLTAAEVLAMRDGEREEGGFIDLKRNRTYNKSIQQMHCICVFASFTHKFQQLT